MILPSRFLVAVPKAREKKAIVFQSFNGGDQVDRQTSYSQFVKDARSGSKTIPWRLIYHRGNSETQN